MNIFMESLIEGAARASGVVAIIDVLRAFTTAAVAFANGATHITMVASVEEALALRSQGIGQICIWVGRIIRQLLDVFLEIIEIYRIPFIKKILYLLHS